MNNGSKTVYEPTLRLPDIEIPMVPNDSEQDSPQTNGVDMLGITAVLVPLIQIDGKAVPEDAVRYFSLSAEGTFPELSLTITDNDGMFSEINPSGLDNEVVLCITPSFPDKYEKIKLVFYITSVHTVQNAGYPDVMMHAVYKNKELLKCTRKVFGTMDSYSFADAVCRQTGLGLISNVESSSDAHYISVCGPLSRELSLMRPGDSPEEIFSVYVDFWNCLHFENLYKSHSVEHQDLTVWGGPMADTGFSKSSDAVEMPLELTNNPYMSTSPLYFSSLDTSSDNSGALDGSSVHPLCWTHCENGELSETEATDLGLKSDPGFVFTRLCGDEAANGYSPELHAAYADAFSTSLRASEVHVSLSRPVFGIMRNGKVNLKYWTAEKEQMAIMADYDKTADSGDASDASTADFAVNKAISGQYTVTGMRLEYSSSSGYNMFTEHLTLSRVGGRTADQKMLKTD